MPVREPGLLSVNSLMASASTVASRITLPGSLSQ